MYEKYYNPILMQQMIYPIILQHMNLDMPLDYGIRIMEYMRLLNVAHVMKARMGIHMLMETAQMS